MRSVVVLTVLALVGCAVAQPDFTADGDAPLVSVPAPSGGIVLPTPQAEDQIIHRREERRRREIPADRDALKYANAAVNRQIYIHNTDSSPVLDQQCGEDECFGNGHCINYKCKCRPMWGGPKCTWKLEGFSVDIRTAPYNLTPDQDLRREIREEWRKRRLMNKYKHRRRHRRGDKYDFSQGQAGVDSNGFADPFFQPDFYTLKNAADDAETRLQQYLLSRMKGLRGRRSGLLTGKEEAKPEK